MASRGKKKTILVIEDETEIRCFVSRVLELEGYNAVQASDGAEGLKKARIGEVSLVLTDLQMPGMDGWAVLKELKGNTAQPALPVILASAADANTNRAKALKMGATDYITKPFSAANLRATISHALSRP